MINVRNNVITSINYEKRVFEFDSLKPKTSSFFRVEFEAFKTVSKTRPNSNRLGSRRVLTESFREVSIFLTINLIKNIVIFE